MLDAKDPAIKLFGKTIPVPEIPAESGDSAGAPAPLSVDVVDECVEQNHASSANSTSSDAQEQEEIEKKVWRIFEGLKKL